MAKQLIYSCEVSLSLDRCVETMDREKIPYTVHTENTLAFRSVTRRAKEILARHGFVQVKRAEKPADLERLFRKYS